MSRLEDRCLDPDYNTIPEDEDDDEWEEADMKGEEEWAKRYLI